ncbi:hypothetical protein C2S52_023338 [Perilla frutescens var. hirtella]|nr:hypothetical protein C2S52_023338 [Perilla frutescens var. hirtella]
MAERSQRPYDPYHDWILQAGRENFHRLFLAEVRTMADNHSKDANYRRFRRQALQFIERHYTASQFDALVPYMAMTFVDRCNLDGQIPTVIDGADNTNLFLTCCLIISWKLRTKRFELESFQNAHKLHFRVENVIEMETRICTKLDWRLRTMMPFWFIDFFVPYLNNPSSALRLVYQLIVKAQSEIAFTEFRPSVIATSALQIVTKKVLPDQAQAFETYIIKSEFIAPLQDRILRCSMILEKLYKGPPPASRDPAPADRGGASSSAAPKRSHPISIPLAAAGRQGKEPAASSGVGDPIHCKGNDHASDDEDPTHREGNKTAFDDEEPAHGEGSHSASDDEEPTRREGKHPADEDKEPAVDEVRETAASEIQPIQEMGTGMHRLFQDEDNYNLMNFKLGWIEEAEAEAEAEAEVVNTLVPYGGYFADFLAKVAQCCNIL